LPGLSGSPLALALTLRPIVPPNSTGCCAAQRGTVSLASELLSGATEEAHMPAIIIPVLWVGGAAILLGGGWYVIGHMVH